MWPQIRLRSLFEITAACGIICATLVYRSLFLDWLAFSLLMVWAARVQPLTLRWSLMSCFGGCAAVFLGLMCLHVALTDKSLSPESTGYEYLAFAGPLISACGVGFAVTGLVLTFRNLVGLKLRDSR